MTRLRAQLHSAGQAYASIRYPGDLSAEVLGGKGTGQRLFWLTRFGFGAGALAAVVTLVMVLSRHVSGPPIPPGPSKSLSNSIARVTKPAAPAPPDAPVPTSMPNDLADTTGHLPYGMGEGMEYLGTLDHYVTLMEKFSRLSQDPGAVSTSPAGPKTITPGDGDAGKAIQYFTEVFPQVKNEAVQRTLRILTDVSSPGN